MNQFNHEDFKQAYRSMTSIMQNAPDEIDPIDLSDNIIGDIVAMECILKKEGHREVKYGKVFLPRNLPRNFMRKKGKMLSDLIDRLGKTAAMKQTAKTV